MYVLALENGYLVVDEAPSGGSHASIDSDNSEVITFGQIVIDSYNRQLKEYLRAGGTIQELKRAHTAQSKGRIPLFNEGDPVPPMILNPTAQASFFPLSEDFTDIDDTQYFKVSYRAYRGNITPVFQVDKLSDLYMYDLFQIRKNHPKRIRICENCGKAFSGEGRSNARYCDSDECKNSIEENKRKNFSNKPHNVIFKRIKDRRDANHCNEDQATYHGYYNNLCIVRDRAEEAERENIERGDYSGITERITALALWDTQFFNLCKFYRKEDNNKVMVDYLDQYETDREEWNTHKSEFPLSTDDPAQWLNEWIDRRNSLT